MKILASIAILFCFSDTFAQKKENLTVAEVNGVKIKKSEFEKNYKENLLFVSDKVVTKEKVLNDMINKILGVQKAKKNNLQENPTVKKKMEDILYHAQISKDLEPKLKEIEVTDKEVKKFYKDHKEYRSAHILFRLRAEPSEKEVKNAMKQAMKVYKKLKEDPKKFAELANKYSQTTVAENGGDIGFQPYVQLAPQYFDAIKSKEPETITPPVRTQFGYHIIKILAVKDFKDINMSYYKKLVYDQKRDQILEEYFEGLKKSAKIKINKEAL